MKPDYDKLLQAMLDGTVNLHELLQETVASMQEFVDRVDAGNVRSTYTYNKFKKILEKWEL